MVKSRWLGVLGLAGMTMFGCGGEENSGPPAMAGKGNPTGARAVVNQTVMIQEAAMAKNGASLSGNVQVVALTGAQQIVMPAVGAAIASLASAQTTPGTSGTVKCDDNGCTYDKFMSGGYTTNGSIRSSASGGITTVITDLTMKGSGAGAAAGQTIDWKITGNLAISATTINGSLQSSGTGNTGAAVPGAPNVSYTYFNNVKYNALTISGKQPTAGSIYGKWGVTVAGIPQGSQAWEATVTFP